MITFHHKTFEPSIATIQRYIYCLGLAAAGAIILVLLWFLAWLAQEVVLSIAELIHLVSVTNPMVITGLLIVLAVFLMGKVSKRSHAA